MPPSLNPVTVAECEVPPVVLKVLVIEPYATPAVRAYRHTAFSSVAREIEVDMVPAGSVPFGTPFERTGGSASGNPTMV